MFPIPTRRAALLGGLSLALPPAAQASTDLLNRLRAGGATLYIRHGEAVRGARPGFRSAWPDELAGCIQPERPLSTRGVADMRRLGDALRAAGVTVAEVRASPACRTLETALFAFGHVTPDPLLSGLWLGRSDPAADAARVAHLRDLFAEPPATGLRALAGHISNIQAVQPGLILAEGDAVAFASDGATRFRQLGVLRIAALT